MLSPDSVGGGALGVEVGEGRAGWSGISGVGHGSVLESID